MRKSILRCAAQYRVTDQACGRICVVLLRIAQYIGFEDESFAIVVVADFLSIIDLGNAYIAGTVAVLRGWAGGRSCFNQAVQGVVTPLR